MVVHKETGMKPLVMLVILVSLFSLLFASSPVLTLKIQSPKDGALLYCSPMTDGEDIFSESINSIYHVPVRERWRIREDATIQVLEVVSSAAVMEYYRLDDFSGAGNGEYRGLPKELSYSKITMKVDARGEERLIVQGQEIALYRLVPEAAVVEISVARTPRIAACF
jgi:hypothetical protein